MKKFKLKLWLSLAVLGLIGVASLLFSDLPLDKLPIEVSQKFSLQALKLLILINPALLLIIMVTVGVLIYDKVGFRLPVFEKVLNKPDKTSFSFRSIVKQGVILGVLSGILILCTVKISSPYLPTTLTDINNQANLHIITKLLYGGFYEEILIRFGLMSLFVWLSSKIVKKQTRTIYWIAIILTSLLFAFGHFPYVFQIVSEPTLSTYHTSLSVILLAECFADMPIGNKGLKAHLSYIFLHT